MRPQETRHAMPGESDSSQRLRAARPGAHLPQAGSQVSPTATSPAAAQALRRRRGPARRPSRRRGRRPDPRAAPARHRSAWNWSFRLRGGRLAPAWKRSPGARARSLGAPPSRPGCRPRRRGRRETRRAKWRSRGGPYGSSRPRGLASPSEQTAPWPPAAGRDSCATRWLRTPAALRPGWSASSISRSTRVADGASPSAIRNQRSRAWRRRATESARQAARSRPLAGRRPRRGRWRRSRVTYGRASWTRSAASASEPSASAKASASAGHTCPRRRLRAKRSSSLLSSSTQRSRWRRA